MKNPTPSSEYKGGQIMFKVPEKYRITTGMLWSDSSFKNNGRFVVPSPVPGSSRYYAIIASDGLGWEHVSVHVETSTSQKTYTPDWEEMQFIKNLFWEAEDLVIQYHPPQSRYMNVHPHVLHLWRVQGWEATLPQPPLVLI
jgi:hypothetical protein